jgi:hypothetical protein
VIRVLGLPTTAPHASARTSRIGSSISHPAVAETYASEPRIVQLAGIPEFPGLVSFREASSAPVPDRICFLVSQDERVVLLHHFPSKDEVCLALLHLRAGEGDLVTFTDVHAHVVEEGLWA